MTRYPALIDGKRGAYGVTFPDLPGIAAMGETLEEAVLNAEEALRDCAVEAGEDGVDLEPPSAIEDVAVPSSSALVSVPLTRSSGG